MKFLQLTPILLLTVLAACSDGDNTSEAKEDKATVFDGHHNALEKTKNIENMLQKSADERQDDIDEY
jgi:hypothetical protein